MKTQDILFIISLLIIYFMLGFCSWYYLGHGIALSIVIVFLSYIVLAKNKKK